MNAFWMVLAVVVCAALVYLGYRIEPHHVAKDGSRFLTSGQWLSSEGQPEGRRREVWVRVLGDGQLQIDVKRRMRHDVTHWSIEGKSTEPPKRRAVYVLRTINRHGATQRMTIKVPASSRAVTILDEAIAARNAD